MANIPFLNNASFSANATFAGTVSSTGLSVDTTGLIQLGDISGAGEGAILQVDNTEGYTRVVGTLNITDSLLFEGDVEINSSEAAVDWFDVTDFSLSAVDSILLTSDLITLDKYGSGNGNLVATSWDASFNSVTSPTFLGDLNGTINTATTGVTQTAGNNSTKIATTAYADAAAAAVPIGNYLPLTGGTLTGTLNINNTLPTIKLTDTDTSAYGRIKSSNGSLTLEADEGNTQADSFIKFEIDTDEKMRITSAGNVGIGTTSPVDRLDLYDADDNVGIYFHTATSGTGGGNGLRVGQNNANAFVWNYEATPLSLATSGTARLTINATGGIRFNTGYGAGTLVTDVSGNITVSSGGGAGGPYLPLTAGSGNTLTGDLFIEGASTPKIRLTDTTNSLEGQIRVGNNYMYIEADTPDSVGSTRILFRTDGLTALYLDGNQNATFAEAIAVQGTGDSYFTGNVGIGTTSPSEKLSIEGAGEQILSIYSTDTGAVNTPKTFIKMYGENTASAKREQVRIASAPGSSASSAGQLIISTSDTDTTLKERLRINEDGNVGIGTTSPDEKLEVIGNYKQKASEGNTQGFTISIDSGTDVVDLNNYYNAPLTFSTNNTERIRIDANGNFGIGTTSPSAKLDVSGDVLIDSGEYLSWGTVGATSIEGSTASNKLQFRTSSTDRMIINDTGVGIGTTSPLKTLSVNGGDIAVNNGNSFIVGAAITGDTQIGELGADSGQLRLLTESTRDIKFASTTYGDIMFLEGTNGNVGIGTTSPSSKLEVNGQTVINSTLAGNQPGLMWFNNQTEIFSFEDNSGGGRLLLSDTTVKVAISANSNSYFNGGNVGIGTTNPRTKLNVSGSSADGGGVLTLENSTTATGSADYVGKIQFYGNDSGTGASGIRASIDANIQGYNGETDLVFSTAPASGVNAEAMRITSVGDVFVGKSSGGLSNVGMAFRASNVFRVTRDGGAPVQFNRIGSNGSIVTFYRETIVVGSISVTTSATAYNTSSDYRLKEDLQDFAGLDIISKIPVYDFKWKTDESRSYGVMAHELQEILPDAVSGEKDAEEMQGVDYSKIVPLLIKSIQELTAKVERLEEKNTINRK